MKKTAYRIDGLNTKIAVLADLHDRECDSVISVLESDRPDIVVIPGDICDFNLSYEGFIRAQELYPDSIHMPEYKSRTYHTPDNALKLIDYVGKRFPSFISRGNHEWMWNDTDFSILKDRGLCYIENEFVKFDKFCFGGLYNTRKPGEKYQWLDSFEQQEEYKIILMHEPQMYGRICEGRNIGLVISGHAHGGQWRIFGQGILSPGQGLFPKYTRGIYGNMVVSAGMSNSVIVPRLFNPKEVVYLF